MLSFPNAKINLGLFVTEKRSDGYHNLESVFYPIKFYDLIEFVEDKKHEKGSTVSLTITGHNVDGPIEDNLCVKAYKLLEKKYKLPPIKIHLHKNIPLGAGLGGGSADGTEMLISLNKHFELKISEKQMHEYAKELGSDCPFFLKNEMLHVSGIGDKFKEVKNSISGFYLLLYQPDTPINTAEAYKSVTLMKPPIPYDDLLRIPLRKWEGNMINCFEEYAFREFPQIKDIKDKMYESGAMFSSMTGSGSAVYGIFDFKIDLSDVIKEKLIWEGYL